jgi:hypothetical protein
MVTAGEEPYRLIDGRESGQLIYIRSGLPYIELTFVSGPLMGEALRKRRHGCAYQLPHPSVLTMETAEPWDCCDLTDCLRWSAEWSILIECKVRSYAVVICLVIGEQMANMPLPQRHDMIEALASDRSDQPFNMTVLPRRAWGDRPISDAHGSQPAGDRNTIARVTIADELR